VAVTGATAVLMARTRPIVDMLGDDTAAEDSMTDSRMA